MSQLNSKGSLIISCRIEFEFKLRKSFKMKKKEKEGKCDQCFKTTHLLVYFLEV